MEVLLEVTLLPSTCHAFHSILYLSFSFSVLYFSDTSEEGVVGFEFCQDLNICRAGKKVFSKIYGADLVLAWMTLFGCHNTHTSSIRSESLMFPHLSTAVVPAFIRLEL